MSVNESPGTMALRGCLITASEQGRRLLVSVDGEFDFACRDDFHQIVLPLARGRQAGQIEVDCSEVSFTDLAGLDILLEMSLAARNGGQVTIVNPPAGMLQLMKYTKSTIVFDVVSPN